MIDRLRAMIELFSRKLEVPSENDANVNIPTEPPLNAYAIGTDAKAFSDDTPGIVHSRIIN